MRILNLSLDLHTAQFVIVVLLAGCASTLSPNEPQLVANKTYVITGASSGFWRGVALEVAAMKANVVLAACRTEVLNEVAAQASAASGTPLVVTTDVSRPDDVRRLADAAIVRFGRIDVWINNAAAGDIGYFDRIPLEDYARVIVVNLKGLIYGSHIALRQLRKQGAGTLVNIGSIENVVPQALHAIYAATKAATLSLGRSLNEELRLSGAQGIKVSTVLPWATDTHLGARHVGSRVIAQLTQCRQAFDRGRYFLWPQRRESQAPAVHLSRLVMQHAQAGRGDTEPRGAAREISFASFR